MTTYTLQVGIQNTECGYLKENNYNLCLAKASDQGYTVIWHEGDFSERNHFIWSEEYQVLWTEKHESTILLLETASSGSEVNFGQTVEIKPDGQMGEATGSADPSAHSFTVVNHLDRDVQVVLNSRINGSWKRCYVSPSLNFNDTMTFTPINKVKIWFDQKLATSTMIGEVATPVLEADFTQGSDSQVVWYGAPGSNYGDKGPVAPDTAVWRVIPDMKPDASQ